MKYLRLKTEPGLTLIGVLISLFIMSVGLGALAYMAENNLKESILVYRQTESDFLVYDAFEIMRNIRDGQANFRAQEILAGKTSTILDGEGEYWDKDFRNEGSYLISCDTEDCHLVEASSEDIFNDQYNLSIDKGTGLYSYQDGENYEPSRHYRRLQIENVSFEENAEGNPDASKPNLKKITVYVGVVTPEGDQYQVEKETFLGKIE